jgi:hypothetical protein
MSHPTSALYKPDYKILLWPADDTSGSGTELVVESGDVGDVLDELIREANIELPCGINDLPDEWADFDVELLQRGTWMEITVSEDGFRTATYNKKIFYGAMTEVAFKKPSNPSPSNPPKISITARDPLMSARSQGVNLSFATRMLVYETTWDHDGAEWDPSDPNFLVNIPDNLQDWVPHGLISLVAYKTAVGDVELYEYEPSEFAYSSGNKQIYFKNSQNDKIIDADEYQWKIRLNYYDPTDTATTVKKLLEAVLTGDPYSSAGGLGFAIGDVDLKPIMGFSASGIVDDAYGYWYAYGDEKLVGILTREKVDGPIVQFLDELRDSGMLPLDYRIWFDPTTKKVLGRYMLQDAALIVDPHWTITEDEQSTTAEQLAGRVEVYAKASTLEDFAPGATITAVTPTFDDPNGGAYDGDPYTVVPTGATTANLVDGKPDTSYQHQFEVVNFHNPVPQRTAENYLQFDLLEQKTVKRIQLTSAVPLKGDGTDQRIYYEQWKPKITISGSMSAITAANPGTPVSPDAINVSVDPRSPGSNGGLDVDVTCDWLWLMRYVAIRFEQDYYFRASDSSSLSGTVYRESYFGLSSVKILGDGYVRYLTGMDAGEVPYAQITNKGGDITANNSGAQTVTVSLAQAANFTAGDYIALWDTSTAQPFGNSGALYTNQIHSVNYGTGVIELEDPFPTEDIDGTPATVANGDKIGWWKRWMLDLTATWVDFYYPKLWRKIQNTFDWLEVVPTEEVGDASEAEGLAVERLLTLISVSRDHRYLTTLDNDMNAGVTTRHMSETELWIANTVKYHLNPSGGAPRVELTIEGTGYEETPE